MHTDDVDLPATYALLQANVQSRRAWYYYMRDTCQRVAGLLRASTPEQITQAMHVTALLGKGEYSSVYLGTLHFLKGSAHDFPVAAKHMIVKKRDRSADCVRRAVRQVLREEIAYLYLNALVLLGVCVSYPLVFNTYLSSTSRMHNSVFLMEASDHNMSALLRDEDLGEEPLMGAVAQVLFGCVAMVTALDLVNNDLYPKNILVNKCAPLVYHYTLGAASDAPASVFVVNTHGYVLKLADFGICSSPLILNYSHDEGNRYFDELFTAASFTEFDYSTHILAYDNVPPRMRDIITLLRSVSESTAARACAVRAWCHYALRYMQYVAEACAEKNASVTPGAVARAVAHVLAAQFLERSGLANAHMFEQPHAQVNEYYDIVCSDDTRNNVREAVSLTMRANASAK